MGRVSTLADFGLGGGDLPASRLYTTYDPNAAYLAQRAATIRGKFSNPATKILIAGCGIGTLVNALTTAGYTDVWGCDASSELITYGKALYPAVSSRLLVANILNNSGNQLPSMTGVRRAAGLNGNARFPLCLTDDVLTVLTDAEVQTALTVLRATANTLAHICWLKDTTTTQDPTLNWKTQPEWQSFIGGGEWLIDARDGTVYGANGEIVP